MYEIKTIPKDDSLINACFFWILNENRQCDSFDINAHIPLHNTS